MCGCCLALGMQTFPWSALGNYTIAISHEAFANHQMTPSRGGTCKTWLGLPGVVGDCLGCVCSTWWTSSTTSLWPCGPSWGVMASVTHQCSLQPWEAGTCTNWISISDPSNPCWVCLFVWTIRNYCYSHSALPTFRWVLGWDLTWEILSIRKFELIVTSTSFLNSECLPTVSIVAFLNSEYQITVSTCKWC